MKKHLPSEKGLKVVCVSPFFLRKNRLFFLHPPPQKKGEVILWVLWQISIREVLSKSFTKGDIHWNDLFQDVFAEFALNVGVVECNYNLFRIKQHESHIASFPMSVLSFCCLSIFLFWVGHFHLFFRWDSRMPHEVHWFETSHIEQQLFTW